MKSNPENRDKTRFEHESALTVENSDIGVQRGVRMFNYSNFGIYFEADFDLQPEAEVRIGILNSPFASEPDKFESYRGVVKWRKKLQLSSFYYGYGIKLIKAIDENSEQKQHDGTRERPRERCAIPIRYELKGRIYEGIAENVSSGGLFIKTREAVALGQQLMVEIHLKKKGEIKRFVAQATWSNTYGFGVKFISSNDKNSRS